MAEVTLKHIKKVYPNTEKKSKKGQKKSNLMVTDEGVLAVQDFNLDIKDREFIVLVGPSGCGKSTTLRMVAGLEEISGGELLIDGKRMNDVAPKGRDIAMVFQSYALYPHMTVRENMEFPLKLRKMPKDEMNKRVDEVAEILDITQYLDRKPKALSGGQRQRVAIGRAIVREPKVLLMDEPLSNLDAKLRVQMRTEITKLYRKLQTTFIYVTHDQVEAMTMATKIVLMNDGKIQQVGKPYEFYEKPQNMFVARFIGSPTINMIKGKMEGKKFVSEDGLISINPSESDLKALSNYEGKDVYLGIRSERFVGDADKDTFECTVDVIEVLGKEKTLYVKLNSGKDLVITVPGYHQYETGEKHKFGFDLSALHFFDAETQLRIN